MAHKDVGWCASQKVEVWVGKRKYDGTMAQRCKSCTTGSVGKRACGLRVGGTAHESAGWKVKVRQHNSDRKTEHNGAMATVQVSMMGSGGVSEKEEGQKMGGWRVNKMCGHTPKIGSESLSDKQEGTVELAIDQCRCAKGTPLTQVDAGRLEERAGGLLTILEKMSNTLCKGYFPNAWSADNLRGGRG
ncbi:hypothetical protein K488DRAFT_74943 [Vararia minispora EC-137]|uniref:Uncharacterized protein n=1 Tax=Vararia minispora EC-137 TaxID=1314806 RepID=A0ACB8Q658_9AGAM|nr:hypothetical protein K488DRAFT_74943 [Vararia minispora EC-137]